ncbi:MAG TPA: aminotransferase class V-fold PLP-dependent enzyme [Thermoanaerobaculia bacterium]|nr:aminotransferase class V-fold PLP-dependent enzyme [Thermoanaerobaculia bacterium]
MTPRGSQPGSGEPREDAPVRGLDPPPAAMRAILRRVVDLLVDDRATLGERRVGLRASAADLAAVVDEPLPRGGLGAEATVDAFFERIVPHMTRVDHPRFHAYIPCPSSFQGMLGAILAAGTNPFVGSWLGGAAVCALELTVLRWIAEAIGCARLDAGVLTSGGSLANLTAIATARRHHADRLGGRGVLYFSAQGHLSAQKAAELLGFPPEHLRVVATDRRFRLRVHELERQLARDRAAGLVPFFVCANGGTTNTGAIDPLPELATLCRREGLWLHVDAAYGGFAALGPTGRARLAGMPEADSLTLDPHKWLYTPIGVGCFLTRHRASFEGAFHSGGDYLQDVPRDEVNFFDRGPELTRPGRVLAVWALMRSVGADRLAREVEEDLRLAAMAERWLAEDPRFEIVTPVALSIVTFRHAGAGLDERERARRDRALMELTLAEGEIMLSTTELDGRSALRLVVLNHRTSEAEVRRTVEVVRRAAERVAAG